MINLDQVRTLEWKVKQAVQLIVHLRRENDTLRGRLSDTEVRLQELETMLESFKATQTEMESGIRNALEDLDHLEGDSSFSSGPVDPLSYPPVSVPAPAVVVAETPDEEPSFEEEYAALAAAEAEALAATSFDNPVSEEPIAPEEHVAPDDGFVSDDGSLDDGGALPEEPMVASTPESIELEDEISLEAQAESEPETEPVTVVPEERRPEQPGLGIF